MAESLEMTGISAISISTMRLKTVKYIMVPRKETTTMQKIVNIVKWKK